MRYATARAKSTTTPSSPSFYEWKVEGQPVSIQLSFDVIDRLSDDVMKGFWAVPKRGAEVGGLLLGRVVRSESGATVWIDDFEPVTCEYRRGPSYVLSEADRRRLERALRKAAAGGRVVGFYRSHTRLGLYLDQDDYALIRNYFGNLNQVFLLVRPQASKMLTGGFFFWEEGGIRRQSTYREFPFNRAELLKVSGAAAPQPEEEAEAPAVRTPRASPVTTSVRAAADRLMARARTWRMPAIKVPPIRVAAIKVPPMKVPSIKMPSIKIPSIKVPALRWRAIGLAALGVFAFAILEYQVLKAVGRDPVPVSADAYPALRIERNGSYLQVNWNRDAASLLHANRGLLSISDGVYRKELELDAAQLRHGSVAYAPSGNDVSFRLELRGSRRTVTESLRVLTGPAQAAPARAAVPAPPRPAPVVAPQKPPQQPPAEAVSQKPPQAPPVERAAKARPKTKRAWYDDGL